MDSADLERRFVETLLELADRTPDRAAFSRIADALLDELEGDRVFVLLLRQTGGFRCLVARDRDREDVSDAVERVSHFAVRCMLESGEMLVVPDARTDRRFRSGDALEGRRAPISLVVYPLRVLGEIVGAVYVDHRFRRLDSEDAALSRVQRWVAAAACALAARDRARSTRMLEKELRGRRPREGDGAHEARPRGREIADDAVPALVAGAWRDRERHDFHGIRSCNPDMLDLFEMLSGVRDTDLPILIVGETGVGKGRLALAVHRVSSRRDGPFVAVGCASIPDTLVESELLGHARGAFTGAETDRVGLLEQADGGTLFLDGVGDMSPALQRLLLRVLEDGIVRPLGARGEKQVDVRVVAAGSKDLEQLVERGRFRRDLYFRLKGLVVTMPPLRDRWEDVPFLVESILAEAGAPETEVRPSALEALVRYPWPGNVRELENELRRLVALAVDPIDVDSLAPAVRGRRGAGGGLVSASSALRLELVLDEVERRTIEEALRRSGGNKSRAAELLGITRKALYRRLDKHGLGREAPARRADDGPGGAPRKVEVGGGEG